MWEGHCTDHFAQPMTYIKYTEHHCIAIIRPICKKKCIEPAFTEIVSNLFMCIWFFFETQIFLATNKISKAFQKPLQTSCMRFHYKDNKFFICNETETRDENRFSAGYLLAPFSRSAIGARLPRRQEAHLPHLSHTQRPAREKKRVSFTL